MSTRTIVSTAYCLRITEVSFKQDSVTTKELIKCVAHRITSLADLDSLHHSRITELTEAQLSVQQLRHRWKGSHLPPLFHKRSSFNFLTDAHVLSLRLRKLSFWPHHGLLGVIRLDAAYEKGLARRQRLHQWIQRLAELANQSGYALLCIHMLLSDA